MSADLNVLFLSMWLCRATLRRLWSKGMFRQNGGANKSPSEGHQRNREGQAATHARYALQFERALGISAKGRGMLLRHNYQLPTG